MRRKSSRRKVASFLVATDTFSRPSAVLCISRLSLAPSSAPCMQYFICSPDAVPRRLLLLLFSCWSFSSFPLPYFIFPYLIIYRFSLLSLQFPQLASFCYYSLHLLLLCCFSSYSSPFYHSLLFPSIIRLVRLPFSFICTLLFSYYQYYPLFS